MAKVVYRLITQQEANAAVFAFVPNLPGCRFHGPDLNDVLQEAKPRIENQLKALVRTGKRRPRNPLTGIQAWDIVINKPSSVVSAHSKRPGTETIYKICTMRGATGRIRAYVPNLLGCEVEGHGLDDLLQNAKPQIEAYLKALLQSGLPIPDNPPLSIHQWDIVVDHDTFKSKLDQK